MCVCTHSSTHRLTNTLTHKQTHAHKHCHARTHTHEHTHESTRIHINTHTHAHTHERTQTHARTQTNTHTYTHVNTHTQACTLVTKAETTKWSPGLFDWLVGQFFSKLRRHHALKTRFPVLIVDSLLASLLYAGTLTTEEC